MGPLALPRFVPCAVAALALALGAMPARAAVGSGQLCEPTDAACAAAVAAGDVWRAAIRVDQVSRRYDGSGIGVALIDTGATPADDLGGRLAARVDLTAEADGADHYGHGTHMAGLIAGDGTRGGGPGAAPGARLVSVKVAGWDGATDVSTVIAGLHWAVANRDRYGLRVVNLSYGTDGVQPTDRDPLDYAVERAWRAGLVVVVSAGNTGATSKPGDDPFVITVGAADLRGTVELADDAVADFSGRGAGKPDVLAPGVSLLSLRAPDSTIDVFNPGARVGDAYFRGTGTSQAAAIVTGVVARMVEANPALSPDEIKGALVATAEGVPAGPGAGAGVVDAAAAVARAAASVKKGSGPGVPTPRANRALAAANGLGSIAASRGTEAVVADLDGDGAAEPLAGEVDALGRPWDAARFAADPWTALSFAASPWAARVTEVTGGGGGIVATTPAPRVGWEARHWGATDWVAAGWDPESWAARHWGARHWGSVAWQ